jgi:hypothetical protein
MGNAFTLIIGKTENIRDRCRWDVILESVIKIECEDVD